LGFVDIQPGLIDGQGLIFLQEENVGDNKQEIHCHKKKTIYMQCMIYITKSLNAPKGARHEEYLHTHFLVQAPSSWIERKEW